MQRDPSWTKAAGSLVRLLAMIFDDCNKAGRGVSQRLPSWNLLPGNFAGTLSSITSLSKQVCTLVKRPQNTHRRWYL